VGFSIASSRSRARANRDITVPMGTCTTAAISLYERVRGSPTPADAGRNRQRAVVDAFLRAVAAGDLEGLLDLLDPDAVIRIDAAARFDGVVRIDAPAAEAGKARELVGASTWAPQLIALSRGMRFVQPALINGSVGLILAPRGKLSRALIFIFANARISRVEAIGDAARLAELDIAVL
jgi:RNA polymerase sigma-70 factor (ECF subfamily)